MLSEIKKGTQRGGNFGMGDRRRDNIMMKKGAAADEDFLCLQIIQLSSQSPKA
tara:strand:- start:763 stop:921 length:159 start_codon:yes stop_codon:yes gene_type:complete